MAIPILTVKDEIDFVDCRETEANVAGNVGPDSELTIVGIKMLKNLQAGGDQWQCFRCGAVHDDESTFQSRRKAKPLLKFAWPMQYLKQQL